MWTVLNYHELSGKKTLELTRTSKISVHFVKLQTNLNSKVKLNLNKNMTSGHYFFFEIL